MSRIRHLTRPIVRQVEIAGTWYKLTIAKEGLSMKPKGKPERLTLPMPWADILRDGGALDAAEIASRPILAFGTAPTKPATTKRSRANG